MRQPTGPNDNSRNGGGNHGCKKSITTQSQTRAQSDVRNGLIARQLDILGYIGDATYGLDKALASEQNDGVRQNDDLHVFSGMARGINCAAVGLFNTIVDQKIGGGT